MLARTLLVFGSTRVTVPSPWFSVQTPPSPNVRNRGALPTEIVSTTRFVFGSTRVRRLRSVLVIQTAPSPNVTQYDPAATRISATTLLSAGSMRASVPFLSVIIHTLPAPVAIPPSVSPIAIGKVAVTLSVLRSTRERVLSPQFGTHRLPNPIVRPEHGLLPTGMTASTLSVFASS